MNIMHWDGNFRPFYLAYIPSYRRCPNISCLQSFEPKLTAESTAHDSVLL